MMMTLMMTMRTEMRQLVSKLYLIYFLIAATFLGCAKPEYVAEIRFQMDPGLPYKQVVIRHCHKDFTYQLSDENIVFPILCEGKYTIELLGSEKTNLVIEGDYLTHGFNYEALIRVEDEGRANVVDQRYL